MVFSTSSSIESFFQQQLVNWELARQNYTGLQKVLLKSVPFNNFRIMVQYNPGRIISTSAKVDPDSISRRPCFLCEQNRPSEQDGIRYKNDFVILVNPYPIFQRHLTIPTWHHRPQRIEGNFHVMLDLAVDLQGYTIIYNGPQCGASAPDHFHFQAVPGDVLPVESDFLSGDKCRFRGAVHHVQVYSWTNYLRRLITLTGDASDKLEKVMGRILSYAGSFNNNHNEPMVNILAGYTGNNWIIHIFPREKHRPEQYFELGDRQLLLSPASIDMGGILIVPREEDFKKITDATIEDVYDQVSLPDEHIENIIQRLIHE